MPLPIQLSIDLDSALAPLVARLTAVEQAKAALEGRVAKLEAAPVTPPVVPPVTPPTPPDPVPQPLPGGQVRTVTDSIADVLLVAGPSDEIVVPYRPASDPWRERLPLWHSGTMSTPFKVTFRRGPNGERNTVDARGAKNDPRLTPFLGTILARMGLCVVHQWPGKPSPAFIEVTGLHLTGASPELPDNKQWDPYACALWAGRCDNVRWLDCEFSWSANGIFGHGMFLPTNTEFVGGTAHDNGSSTISPNDVLGGGKVHQTYWEGKSVKWTGFTWGRLKPGALGGNLKDRSSNLVIAGGSIDGGKRMLDFSDYQDSAQVNGNIPGGANVSLSNLKLINRPGDAVDVIYTEGRRSPEGVGPFVTATNVTLVVKRDQSEVHHLILFRSEYSDAAWLKMSNFLVARFPSVLGSSAWTPILEALGEQGRVELTGKCWANQPVYPLFPIADRSRVTGWDENWTFGGKEQAGGDPDPGFVNAAGDDFRLKPGALAEGFGAEV